MLELVLGERVRGRVAQTRGGRGLQQRARPGPPEVRRASRQDVRPSDGRLDGTVVSVQKSRDRSCPVLADAAPVVGDQ